MQHFYMSDWTTDKTFDDFFSDLVKESNSILIEYSHSNHYYKEDSFIVFEIVSVNGHKTTYQFKKRIQDLYRDSLRKLTQFIATVPYEDRISYLDSIKDEAENLQYIIDDETQIFEENEHGPREEHQFKAFKKASFKGTKDDKLSYYQKSIKRKASVYAETWLECIGELKHKIDFLINQIDLLPEPKEIIEKEYVNLGRIEELKQVTSGDFDLTRLLIICEELNDASQRGNSYSVIMLVRSIMDHVPPIFGKPTFPEVANNYGSKSFKESMTKLDTSSRKIADSALHQHIRKKEVLPNKTQVNFSNDLDVLLGEIVRLLK